MRIACRRIAYRYVWLLLIVFSTPVSAAERFICEGAGSSSSALTSRIDPDKAARAITQTRSSTPRVGVGIGIGHGGGHGYGLGYGFDRFDRDELAYSSAAANQELLKLVIDLQRQVDELSRRIEAPISLVCRPLTDGEAQRLTGNATDRAPTRSSTAAASVSGDQTLYAKVDFVEVFNAPAAGARKVDALRQGTPVKVFERRDDWVRITPDDALPGWVRDALLSPSAP